MKRWITKIATFGLIVFMVNIGTGCKTTIQLKAKNPPAKKAPPGQVKKATGSQSAKPYAPGQQKKKN